MPTTTPNGIVIAHDDHGLNADHLSFIDTALADWDGSFLIQVLSLPDTCESLPSALYGPSVGDEPIDDDQVTYIKRAKRRGPSRLIDAPMRPARNMVVIGMRVEDGSLMLFTAYGTQSDTPSPREWWDLPPINLTAVPPAEASAIIDQWSSDARAASNFWSQHALAQGE
tara:strand:- start:7698 stop:8204 length:507 start_codon:yes stop_codon:yes gene_type:complete